ncbi:MAG: SseB family protein [Thiobacillaceae bacterium]|nr:SseB family protein [Thiobacillaceae bacterium]MCX7672856.1 SseB family protein [Thiobacillaceae bacterium]MDW8324699.1 SseB family protein [Burkholderiales bacterium]
MDDIPRNEVEQLIAEMHAGVLRPEDFARRLLNLQVFMPVRDDKHAIRGFQTSTRAEPLVVEDEEGQRVLILFSAPERAKAFLAQFEGYSGGILTEFSWVLRRLGAGMAIAINPGEVLGFDFDPDMVAMVAALLPEAGE